MSEMKKIYITGLWILCLTSGVSAQTYDIIERRNSWNAGTNVTGIMMDSISASYADCTERITTVISTTITKQKKHGVPER